MGAVAVFRALGDPIRLEMVQRLASGTSYTLTSVSTGLGVTRQGARKHLQVLQEAELVKLEPQGREVLVLLDPQVLGASKEFISELERCWDMRLGALKLFVESGN